MKSSKIRKCERSKDMQLQSLMLMMFMLIVIPVFVLFSDHTTFFIVMALLLFAASVKNIREQVKSLRANQERAAEEEYDELEDDTEKEALLLEKGIVVIKNLMMILFFLYCLFFFHALWLKLLTAAVILYWLRDLAVSLLGDTEEYTQARYMLSQAAYIFVNICTLGLVVIAGYSKLFPAGS